MFGNKSKELLLQKEEELMVVQNELFTLKTQHQTTESDLQQTKTALLIAEADLKRSTEEYAGLVSKYAPIIDIDKILMGY